MKNHVHTTTRSTATGEPFSVISAWRDPTRQWCPEKEAERTEFKKFPNSTTLSFGKRTSRVDFVPAHVFQQKALWMNEVDSARIRDNSKSSDSILEQKNPDFEVLDSHSACALKKRPQSRVYMEDKRHKQDNRFWKGRQITFMIFEFIKINGTGEALLVFNDLVRVQLTNDTVQSA